MRLYEIAVIIIDFLHNYHCNFIFIDNLDDPLQAKHDTRALIPIFAPATWEFLPNQELALVLLPRRHQARISDRNT